MDPFFLPSSGLLPLRHSGDDARFWFCGELSKFSLKNFKAAELVQVLAPLVAADRGDAGRPVDEPNGAFGLVLVLTALAAGPEGLNVAGGEKAEK